MPRRLLTAKQAYVFDRIEDVAPRVYKVTVPNPTPRYELDGEDCTLQINGLRVQRRVKPVHGGRLKKVD